MVPVAAKDKVGVGVDKAGHDGLAGYIGPVELVVSRQLAVDPVPGILAGPYKDNPVFLPDDGPVGDDLKVPHGLALDSFPSQGGHKFRCLLQHGISHVILLLRPVDAFCPLQQPGGPCPGLTHSKVPRP